jgi:zinc transporter
MQETGLVASYLLDGKGGGRLFDGEKVCAWRAEADRMTRYVEDLDAARERPAVTQEELGNRLSEQMNTRMYVLSIVAAIFLPLGFPTGLFGINVAGIPMAENPEGFVGTVPILLLITALQVVLFRWRRWL